LPIDLQVARGALTERCRRARNARRRFRTARCPAPSQPELRRPYPGHGARLDHTGGQQPGLPVTCELADELPPARTEKKLLRLVGRCPVRTTSSIRPRPMKVAVLGPPAVTTNSPCATVCAVPMRSARANCSSRGWYDAVGVRRSSSSCSPISGHDDLSIVDSPRAHAALAFRHSYPPTRRGVFST